MPDSARWGNRALSLRIVKFAAAQGIHMPAQRKTFRIEQMLPFAGPDGLIATPIGSQQTEVLTELKALRARIAQPADAQAADPHDGERATKQIRDAAEAIEDAAGTLAASVTPMQARALAHDIQEQVVRIFEACDVQDLSGQRIGTVLATLAAVTDHIARIMQICGGHNRRPPRTNMHIS